MSDVKREAEAARKDLESELVRRNAQLEAMFHAADGEPVSDFMESFAGVRAIVDLKADRDALAATVERVKAVPLYEHGTRYVVLKADLDAALAPQDDDDLTPAEVEMMERGRAEIAAGNSVRLEDLKITDAMVEAAREALEIQWGTLFIMGDVVDPSTINIRAILDAAIAPQLETE